MIISSTDVRARADYLHPDIVGPLIGRLIEPAIAEDLAGGFGILGDPTRVRILQALTLVEEICVVDLALALEISQSALSHQLALLRGHRVVARRKVGRIVFYRLARGPVQRALNAALRDVLP
jgi:DNA-binding transcriptional ArsR family regulator